MRHCEPTGPREARPDDRLREAIQLCASGTMDCFVARAPRNDGEATFFRGYISSQALRFGGHATGVFRTCSERITSSHRTARLIPKNA